MVVNSRYVIYYAKHVLASSFVSHANSLLTPLQKIVASLALTKSHLFTRKSVMSLKLGDTIPEGSFKYIPYTPELDDNVSPFKDP